MGIDTKVYLEGKCSLRVQLVTNRYSGVHMMYFPENWKGAKRFGCDVFTPSDQVLRLICKINDKDHKRRGQCYEYRFNRQYELPAGWTAIDIDVQDICGAPKGRPMDMAHISGAAFFAMDLPQPRVINIDNVRLIY